MPSKRVFESDEQADKGKERNERKAQQWRKEMKSRKAYPSDVTDAEWELLEPLIPAISPEAVIVVHERREIVNGILYVLRSGCPWRLLPNDLPVWGTVYSYFRTWRNDGIWDQVLAALRQRMRHKQGRDASPSAAVIDSQSMKTSAVRGPDKGIDMGKKNLGTQKTRAGRYRRQSHGSQSYGCQ
jgi:putative transposase